MPKPIDREASLKLCSDTHNPYHRIVREFLLTAPTVDAEPVRHGRMIEGRYPNENKCSECGQEFRDDIGLIIQDDDGVFHYPKRCPECGCYWDGGADNG